MIGHLLNKFTYIRNNHLLIRIGYCTDGTVLWNTMNRFTYLHLVEWAELM